MSFNSFVPSKHLLTFIPTILPEHKDDNPQHLCAMKKTIISLFSLLCLLPCRAQLTIEDCYRQAESNYPLIRQYELIKKTKEYNLENAARGYLPQVAFSAQATYQSDVTHIPIDLNALGFPVFLIVKSTIRRRSLKSCLSIVSPFHAKGDKTSPHINILLWEYS